MPKRMISEQLGMKEVQARDINARWFAHKVEMLGWTLTHRHTGYSAGKGLRTFKDAAALAAALEKAYPPKRWEFTDPQKARGMKKCKAIIREHGAL